jgi:hypothetical protein
MSTTKKAASGLVKAPAGGGGVRQTNKGDIGSGAAQTARAQASHHHTHSSSISNAEKERDENKTHHHSGSGSKHRRESTTGGTARSERDILLGAPPKPRGIVAPPTIGGGSHNVDKETGAKRRSNADTQAAVAAVGSRVWKNDTAMTFGTRVLLAEKAYMWADADIAAKHLIDVWEHYDANGDGILNKNELPALARDTVDRVVAMIKENIKRENPELADKALEEMTKNELPHILPGKDIAECKRMMVEYLNKELDVDHDGVITRTEFMMKWKLTSRQLQTFKVAKAIACNIL